MKKIHYTDIELWLSDYAKFEDFVGIGKERVLALAEELRNRGWYAKANKLLKANGLQQGPCIAKEVAHFGDPCIHCRTPHDDIAPGPCSGRIAELLAENKQLQGIISELDKTADGVPITLKTKLWQADPDANQTPLGYSQPWLCSQDHSYRRDSDKPVYSTSEAAREAEL
jgi:hypothetical protein